MKFKIQLNKQVSFILIVLSMVVGLAVLTGTYINNMSFFTASLPAELAVYPKPANMKMRIKLYFPYQNKLRLEERVATVNQDRIELAVAEQMMRGPKNRFYSSPFGDDVRIVDVNISNSTCYINVTESFLDQSYLKTEDNKLYIWAIVNTFTELEGVNKVQILVEGRKRDIGVGELSLQQTLSRNDDFIYIKRRYPSDVVVEFVEAIDELRYDKAYTYLNSESQKIYTYDMFKEAAKLNAEKFNGYRRSISFSHDLSGTWLIYVKYVNFDKLDTSNKTKLFDLWELTEEDGEWKIIFDK